MFIYYIISVHSLYDSYTIHLPDPARSDLFRIRGMCAEFYQDKS